MSDQSEPDIDAFMRRFRRIIAICVLIPSAPLLAYLFLLHHRLDSLESALHYRIPEAAGDSVVDADLAELTSSPAQGQLVYVPAYSHVYHQDGKPHLLTITLSVRNTSTERGIVLMSVRYFGKNGEQIRSHLDRPLRLAPLAATEFLVERDDTSGGSGASFLVEWVSNQPVTEPIIEAIMIDTSAQQGISFARQGTVIKEKLPDLSGGERKDTPASAPRDGEAR